MVRHETGVRHPPAWMEPDGAAKSKVTLTHLGFAERAAEMPEDRAKWGEVRAYFDKAWPSVLAALQEYFTALRKS